MLKNTHTHNQTARGIEFHWIRNTRKTVQLSRHGKNINSIYILNETSELNKDKNNNEHDNIAHNTPFLYAEVRVFGGKWSCSIRINT